MNKEKIYKEQCVGGFEKIFDMKIGDRSSYDVFDIWRVPNGWLFGVDNGSGAMVLTLVPLAEYVVPLD